MATGCVRWLTGPELFYFYVPENHVASPKARYNAKKKRRLAGVAAGREQCLFLPMFKTPSDV